MEKNRRDTVNPNLVRYFFPKEYIRKILTIPMPSAKKGINLKSQSESKRRGMSIQRPRGK